MNLYDEGSRPVILLGAGISRETNIAPVLEAKVPILSSWAAMDLIDNYHPYYFGRPGVYGQRCANTILHNADVVLALGNRLSIWNTGYSGIRAGRLFIVDIDKEVLTRHPRAIRISMDTRMYIPSIPAQPYLFTSEWIDTCNNWRLQYPWVEEAHKDIDGYLNSYRFFQRIESQLPDDVILSVDAGCACSSAFQVLRLRAGQRIMTSGGLGEMGCALPAAVGASFAAPERQVLAIVGDGAMMLNLQELQTIKHHNLPIKILVFANDGYLMIKHTQEALGYKHMGVDSRSGVSCPDFVEVANAIGISAAHIDTWEDFDHLIPTFLSAQEPCLLQVKMHPHQPTIPKLQPIVVDGKIQSPSFEDMSPRLP